MSKLEPYLHWVDALNSRLYIVVAYLTVVPMTLITAFEVVMRYVFRHPTIWAWDVNIQLLGFMVLMTGAYNILIVAHVRVDIIVNMLSERRRRIVDLVTAGLFVFAFSTMLWLASRLAWQSAATHEGYTGLWQPPIWPFKIMLAIGILLMLLQGIVKFVRDLDFVMHGSNATPTAPGSTGTGVSQ